MRNKSARSLARILPSFLAANSVAAFASPPARQKLDLHCSLKPVAASPASPQLVITDAWGQRPEVLVRTPAAVGAKVGKMVFSSSVELSPSDAECPSCSEMLISFRGAPADRLMRKISIRPDLTGTELVSPAPVAGIRVTATLPDALPGFDDADTASCIAVRSFAQTPPDADEGSLKRCLPGQSGACRR